MYTNTQIYENERKMYKQIKMNKNKNNKTNIFQNKQINKMNTNSNKYNKNQQK